MRQRAKKIGDIMKKYKTNSLIANLALLLAVFDANLCCCMYIFHQPEIPKDLNKLKIQDEN